MSEEVADSIVTLYPSHTKIKFSELRVNDKFYINIEQAKIYEVLVEPYVETIEGKCYYKVDCNICDEEFVTPEITEIIVMKDDPQKLKS